MGNGKDPFYRSSKEHLNACQAAIEAAVSMLENSVVNYCLYDEAFSFEEKISALEACNSILKTFYQEEYFGDSWLSVVYNYGHLSYLCFLNGDENKALEHLRTCVGLAKQLDNAPDEFVSNSLYFRGKTLQKPKRGKSCCERMKQYFFNQYPFSDEFKSKAELKEIIISLEEQ